MSIYLTERRYESEKRMLAKLEISEAEKERISDFLRRQEIENMSVVSLLKYSIAIRQFFSFRKKTIKKITERDLEEWILGYAGRKDKTKGNRWYALKKFLIFCGRKELYDNFRPHFGKSRIKMPEEILTEEEIEKILEHPDNAKHKPFIALLYESGCRISEFLTIQKNQIMMDENGAAIIVNGKTGQRRIRIVKYAHLICDANFNIGYENARRIVRESAIKAGIFKRIYPHIFRHSRATHLAKHLTEQELKKYFGWAGGSNMAAVYVHLSGKDIDDKIIQLNNRTATAQNSFLMGNYQNDPQYQEFIRWKSRQPTLANFTSLYAIANNKNKLCFKRNGAN